MYAAMTSRWDRGPLLLGSQGNLPQRRQLNARIAWHLLFFNLTPPLIHQLHPSIIWLGLAPGCLSSNRCLRSSPMGRMDTATISDAAFLLNLTRQIGSLSSLMNLPLSLIMTFSRFMMAATAAVLCWPHFPAKDLSRKSSVQPRMLCS